MLENYEKPQDTAEVTAQAEEGDRMKSMKVNIVTPEKVACGVGRSRDGRGPGAAGASAGRGADRGGGEGVEVGR